MTNWKNLTKTMLWNQNFHFWIPSRRSQRLLTFQLLHSSRCLERILNFLGSLTMLVTTFEFPETLTMLGTTLEISIAQPVAVLGVKCQFSTFCFFQPLTISSAVCSNCMRGTDDYSAVFETTSSLELSCIGFSTASR